MEKIRVVIADDDSIVVQGLTMILGSQADIDIVGVASNGLDAVRLCKEHLPDVAVLDIRMNDKTNNSFSYATNATNSIDGIEAAAEILKISNPDAQSDNQIAPILLTTFDEPELIRRALDVGARGYILKNSPAERIISAVRTVAQGGVVFAPDVVEFIRTHIVAVRHAGLSDESSNDATIKPAGSDVFSNLTTREQEIAELIATGLSNAQIASKLYLSNGTVRNHISTILEKLELEHRTQVAVMYYSGAHI
ncbi:MAG: response regulator transcription factor [Clostridiales Family XIII bacterium]|jgi:DNA-binding NarL/FixJ family response regulator|nr:response regulator transcription factor [Clostridiales Family XIII bacterium]